VRQRESSATAETFLFCPLDNATINSDAMVSESPDAGNAPVCKTFKGVARNYWICKNQMVLGDNFEYPVAF